MLSVGHVSFGPVLPQRLRKAALASALISMVPWASLPETCVAEARHGKRNTIWWLTTSAGIGEMGDEVKGALASSFNLSFAEHRFVSIRYVQPLGYCGVGRRQREIALMYGVCTPDWR